MPETGGPPSAVPLVGLVPAAGAARRLGRLPFSKELLPVGSDPESGAIRVVAHALLEQMRRAGARPVWILTRAEKADLPVFFGSGTEVGLELVYRFVDRTRSVVETLQAACPLIGDQRVALGFPDVLLEPPNALAAVAAHQAETDADVVLGLVPTARPDKSDMVDSTDDGRVLAIEIKPRSTTLRQTWMLAVWGPRFTELLTGFDPLAAGEAHPGHVVQRAIEDGLDVRAVTFPDGGSIDLGTPEDLARAAAAGFRVPSGGRDER